MLGRSVRTTQPRGPARVERANPIAGGLRFLWCHGSDRDLIAGTLGSVSGTSLGTAATPQGTALRGNTAGRLTFGLRPDLGEVNTSAITVMAVAYIHDADISRGFMSFLGRVSGQFNFMLDFAAGSQQFAFAVNSGSGVTFPALSQAGALAPYDKKTVVLVATYDGANTVLRVREMEAGVGGQNSAPRTGTFFSNPSDPFSLLSRGGPQSFASDAVSLLAAGVWGRTLIEQECQSLLVRPWQVFATDNKALWVPASASVTMPTLVQPASTTSTGAWTATGAATLHQAINEPTPSASEFISVSSASTCVMELANAAFPGGANKAVRYWGSSALGSSLTVTLRQGATQIMTRTHPLASVNTLYTQTLTAPEIATIVAGPISVELTASA